MSRRSFLGRGAAAAVGVPSLAAFLDACSKSGTGAAGPAATATFSVASPKNPVKWPIYPDNKPIASGLAPEKNATVNIYTYTDYLDPGALKSFEKKYKAYNVKCTITTFEDTTEAVGKIRSGGVVADIYNPSYDQIGKMVTAKLLAPLNHDYIPNIANVWPNFLNPFYDQGWQYTTPYTLYGTGIAWRTDEVFEDVGARANPYDVFWDPKYAKKISVLDDYHTCMGMVCLRNKLDVNTAKPADLALIAKQLTELNQITSPKVNVTDYTDVPTKVVELCQAWAGDAVNMISYMPQGQSADVLRYWAPSGAGALVDNDLLVMLSNTKNPVMTQLFLNHMLDYEVAIANFSFTGYQPPQNQITPDKLVSDGFVPKNLASAVVRKEDYLNGSHILELPPDVEAAWQAVWQKFKAGS